MNVGRASVVGGVAACGVLLGGCKGLNQSPQPGPHVELDTLQPTKDFYSRLDKPLEESGASLAGLSRENWAHTVFYVPVSGVEHQPIYTTDKPRRTDSTARQRGEHPAQATAVEGSDWDSTAEQAIEGLLGPFRAGWDVVWLVPKMVATPPWKKVSSPRVGYERKPHPTYETTGGLKDVGLGVVVRPLTPGVAPEPTTPAVEPPNVQPSAPTVEQAPGAAEQPGVRPPPPPPPPGPSPAPAPGADAPPPRGVPAGAIGGSDSPKRREQNKPKEPKE